MGEADQTSGEEQYLRSVFIPLKELGKGGMGAVYEVRADRNHPDYASFLASVLAWSEVTDSDDESVNSVLEPYREELRKQREKLEELLAVDERGTKIRVRESTLEEVQEQKEALKQASADLRAAQENYVNERITEVEANWDRDEIVDGIFSLGKSLPADDRYALKVALNEDQQYLDRLREEFMSTLPHPNINPVITRGTDWYLQNLLRNFTRLEDLIAGRSEVAWTVGHRVEVARTVADTVGYLHVNGIVHRDLKPDNIIIDGDGTVKLLDLGIAKNTQESFGMTMENSTMGTPDYMSKEQALHTEKAEPSFDIYALGCILYESITGETPYTHVMDNEGNIKDGPKSVQAKLAYISGDDFHIVPPSKLVKQVPPELESIIINAVNEDPNLRYPSMENFKRDLDTYLQNEDAGILDLKAFESDREARKKMFEVQTINYTHGTDTGLQAAGQSSKGRMAAIAAAAAVAVGLIVYAGYAVGMHYVSDNGTTQTASKQEDSAGQAVAGNSGNDSDTDKNAGNSTGKASGGGEVSTTDNGSEETDNNEKVAASGDTETSEEKTSGTDRSDTAGGTDKADGSETKEKEPSTDQADKTAGTDAGSSEDKSLEEKVRDSEKNVDKSRSLESSIINPELYDNIRFASDNFGGSDKNPAELKENHLKNISPVPEEGAAVKYNTDFGEEGKDMYTFYLDFPSKEDAEKFLAKKELPTPDTVDNYLAGDQEDPERVMWCFFEGKEDPAESTVEMLLNGAGFKMKAVLEGKGGKTGDGEESEDKAGDSATKEEKASADKPAKTAGKDEASSGDKSLEEKVKDSKKNVAKSRSLESSIINPNLYNNITLAYKNPFGGNKNPMRLKDKHLKQVSSEAEEGAIVKYKASFGGEEKRGLNTFYIDFASEEAAQKFLKQKEVPSINKYGTYLARDKEDPERVMWLYFAGEKSPDKATLDALLNDNGFDIKGFIEGTGDKTGGRQSKDEKEGKEGLADDIAEDNVPGDAVLAMSFDRDTLAKKDGKWHVRDLSGEGNHGRIHGNFAAVGGRPVVYENPKSVPDKYDLALVEGPDKGDDDHAMYFAGKKGYIEVQDDDSLDLDEEFRISVDFSPFTTIKNSYAKHSAALIDRQDAFLLMFGRADGGRLRFGTYGRKIKSKREVWNENEWYDLRVDFNNMNDASIFVYGENNTLNNMDGPERKILNKGNIFLGKDKGHKSLKGSLDNFYLEKL